MFQLLVASSQDMQAFVLWHCFLDRLYSCLTPLFAHHHRWPTSFALLSGIRLEVIPLRRFLQQYHSRTLSVDQRQHEPSADLVISQARFATQIASTMKTVHSFSLYISKKYKAPYRQSRRP